MNFRNRAALAAAMLTAPLPALAQDAVGIDQRINDIFAGSTGWFVNLIFAPLPFSIYGVSFPWIVLWLVAGATIFTLYFGFVQFRAFGHAIALVRGDYSDPDDAGEVSHFQALATALSGTVGLGNIAGRRGGRGHRRAGRHVLDDRRGPAGHGVEVHRMHARA